MRNLGHQLEFCYCSLENSCSGNYSLTRISSIIQSLNYNELRHIHLAYGDRIDQICVSNLISSLEYISQNQCGLSSSLNFHQSENAQQHIQHLPCVKKMHIYGNHKHFLI